MHWMASFMTLPTRGVVRDAGVVKNRPGGARPGVGFQPRAEAPRR